MNKANLGLWQHTHKGEEKGCLWGKIRRCERFFSRERPEKRERERGHFHSKESEGISGCDKCPTMDGQSRLEKKWRKGKSLAEIERSEMHLHLCSAVNPTQLCAPFSIASFFSFRFFSMFFFLNFD